MTDIPALRLEVKKDKWEQLQNGTYKLQVTVNPDDIKDNADDVLLQFIRAGMGDIFMLGLAKVTEQGEPEQPIKPKGGPLSQQAGILCGDERFWGWLHETGQTGLDPQLFDKTIAANWLRNHCRIESRAELDHNPAAAEKFKALKFKFEEAQGMIAEKR
jgi:hypothetical protein